MVPERDLESTGLDPTELRMWFTWREVQKFSPPVQPFIYAIVLNILMTDPLFTDDFMYDLSDHLEEVFGEDVPDVLPYDPFPPW